MISSVFVPDRDIASSDEAMSDRELSASKCLCLGTILANLELNIHLQQHPQHTVNEAFESFNDGDCTIFINLHYRMRCNITNNRTNTPVLEPSKQQLTNIPATAETNDIITEIKAVLSELPNNTGKISVETKQMLLSAMSTADQNGNITNTKDIKRIHPKIHSQINQVRSSTIINVSFGVSEAILNLSEQSGH